MVYEPTNISGGGHHLEPTMIQDGAQKRLRSAAEHKWLNSMVYARYTELVNAVYKPCNL